MSKITLSRHAVDQINTRGIVTAEEVLLAVSAKEERILSSKETEIHVIVRRVPLQQTSDGSTGDTIVACIDRVNRVVSTVMLRRHEQIEKRPKWIRYV